MNQSLSKLIERLVVTMVESSLLNLDPASNYKLVQEMKVSSSIVRLFDV